MRLYITDEQKEDLSFDIITMTTSEFNSIKNHPFISSSKFDEVVIELNENIQLGFIRPLMATTRIIPKIVGDITPHIISILCELYKERAAEIRYTYIRNKDTFGEYLEKMKKEFCWEQFYD